ncbi:MAG: N-acetyltransferase family protein [Chthoniobacterales bacterium]
MTIRDAAESDLPAIVEIFNSAVLARMATAVLEPVSVEERRAWFREHSADHHPLWVLEVDGKIAGWLSMHAFLSRCAYRGTAEVSVYVHEDFRGRGLGRALLQEAIARSPALEVRALAGLIFGHNIPSLRLFEALGFGRWGLLPRLARLDEVDRDIIIVGRHIAAVRSD